MTQEAGGTRRESGGTGAPAPSDAAALMAQLRATLDRARAISNALGQKLDEQGTEPASRAAQERISDLERQLQSMDWDRRELSSRLVGYERQVALLMNLYVATYQLHATLDTGEVQATIAEIAVNLLGAEVFSLLLRREGGTWTEVVVGEGLEGDPRYTGGRYHGGDPAIDATLNDGVIRLAPQAGSDVVAVVPMTVQGVTVGGLVVHKLFEHKRALHSDDRALLDPLAAHAASALYAAEAHTKTSRKLKTLEDLVKLARVWMIQGDLEDVTIVDVLQFIHLGRRSGTLRVWIPDWMAQVGFHRGRIVSAWGPMSVRLGDMLVDEGTLPAEALAAALAQQESENPRRSLGQILIATEQLAPEVVYSAVERQIERTIYDLVTWQEGAFEFALDDLEPMDDIGLYPEDVIPNIELDTQVMMLEAVRIFDERNREGASEKAAARIEELPDPAKVLANVGQSHPRLPAMTGRPEDAPRTRPITVEPHVEPGPETWPILQIVTKDSALYDAIVDALPRHSAKVLRVSPRDAGSPPPGAEPPIVLVDVRRAQVPVRGITSIRRARPRATVLAVREPDGNLAEAYDAGAVNVVPADPQLILAVYRSLARYRSSTSPEQAIQSGVRAGFAKLRRVLGDMRSGFVSATMALNLMHTIADSVERSILFLVRGKSLVALGAFGLGAHGEALAGLTKGLAIPLGEDTGFARTLHAGKSVAMTFDEARLPARLGAMLGRPRSGQVVMFPVLGSKKVIAVIYTDNGRSMSAIQEVDILELATAQMGFAFENELLRHQMARQELPIDGIEAEPPTTAETHSDVSQRVTMRMKTSSGDDPP